MCKLIVSAVHFRARKSRQNQQKEMDLERQSIMIANMNGLEVGREEAGR